MNCLGDSQAQPTSPRAWRWSGPDLMPFLRERSGRWSPVKIVAFVAALLPVSWIAYQAAAGELGARPVTEAIHQAGDWALRFLLITLAITPAQRIFVYPRLVLA